MARFAAYSLLLYMLTLSLTTADAHTAKVTRNDRIAFLGDSITDGDTYILLVGQALAATGKPVPVLINAGVGGDDAAGMLLRLDRDVISQHPTRVFLSCGVNDKVSTDQYRASVTAVADRLHALRIPLILMTPTIPGGIQPDMEAHRAAYIAVLNEIATKDHLAVADVNAQMQIVRSQGQVLIGEDNVHPNYDGNRVIAEAILSALGETELPVPAVFTPSLMPGVLPVWEVRVAPAASSLLDSSDVSTLASDSSWKTLLLPEPTPSSAWTAEPQGKWWQDQERKRGFATGLDQVIGAGDHFQSLGYVDSDTARQVYFNTGGGLQSIWLNGSRIYTSMQWTGWHAGKERVPAQVHKGRNVVVVESSNNFFLSVTDGNTW